MVSSSNYYLPADPQLFVRNSNPIHDWGDKSSDLQFHVRVTCNYDDFAKKLTRLSSPRHLNLLLLLHFVSIYSSALTLVIGSYHHTESVSHRTVMVCNYSMIDDGQGQGVVVEEDAAAALSSVKYASRRISFQPVEHGLGGSYVIIHRHRSFWDTWPPGYIFSLAAAPPPPHKQITSSGGQRGGRDDDALWSLTIFQSVTL